MIYPTGSPQWRLQAKPPTRLMKIPIIYEAKHRETGAKRYFFANRGEHSKGDYVRLDGSKIYRITGVDVKGFNFKAR